MVKDEKYRIKKYAKALQPEAVKKALEAQKEDMVEQQAAVFPKQAELERKVKHLCEAQGIATWQVGQYIMFGKKILKLATKFSQASLAAEFQNMVNLWAARGLSGAKLVEICQFFGVTPTAPPPLIPDTNMFGFIPLAQGAGVTSYFAFHYPLPHATEPPAQVAIVAGKFIKLKVYAFLNTVNGPTTMVLRVNGADTALTITVLAGVTGIFTVEADVPVNEDDLVNYRLTTGGTTGAVDFKPIIVFQPS